MTYTSIFISIDSVIGRRERRRWGGGWRRWGSWRRCRRQSCSVLFQRQLCSATTISAVTPMPEQEEEPIPLAIKTPQQFCCAAEDRLSVGFCSVLLCGFLSIEAKATRPDTILPDNEQIGHAKVQWKVTDFAYKLDVIFSIYRILTSKTLCITETGTMILIQSTIHPFLKGSYTPSFLNNFECIRARTDNKLGVSSDYARLSIRLISKSNVNSVDINNS